eukprot:XP_001698196.1 predicted protein [Chlamydomonas reinhardtii]
MSFIKLLSGCVFVGVQCLPWRSLTQTPHSWARRPTLIDRHLRAGRVALLEQAAQPGGLQRMLIALHSLHLAVIMHRHATAADVTTLHVRPAAAATAASQTLSAGSLRFGARGDGRGTPSRSVVSPLGRGIVPSTTQLVAALGRKDLGFWHLASCGVRKVQELASGKRSVLLAGDMFVPCLSAVATGAALPELQVDRCGRVSLEEQVSAGAVAGLHIGEQMLSGGGVRDASKQVVRSATALAWAYHALLRTGADGDAALPLVLDVRAGNVI